MRRALLDVNVLLALLDGRHASNERAHDWFATFGAAGWASCAITENGVVRVRSQPSYPNPLPIVTAIEDLALTISQGDHEFWPADISLLDSAIVDRTRLHGSRQVTDAYLLALAVSREATLATLDRSIPLSAVHGATAEHLSVIR